MHCYNCKKVLSYEFNFCPDCGVRVKLSISNNDQNSNYEYFEDSPLVNTIENYYLKIIDKLPEGIVLNRLVYSEQGTPINYMAVDVNKAYEEITSLKREVAIQILASTLYNSVEPPYLQEFSRVGLTGYNYYFESYFEPMDIHFSLSLVSPKIGYFAILFNNINKRIALEEEIISKIHQIQLTYDLMEEVVMLVTKKSRRILHVNRYILKLFGYSESDVNNIMLDDLHPKDHKDHVLSIYLDDSIKSVPCLTFQKNNGELFYGKIIKKEITYKNISCYLIFIKDISDQINRKKIQENFIASLSHDLKVPLLAEGITLKYFLKGSYGQPSDLQIEILKKLIESNAWLVNMVNQLVDLYRNEAVKIEPLLERTNINDLINKSIEEFTTCTINNHRNVNLKLDSSIPNSKMDIIQIKKIIKYQIDIITRFSIKYGEIKTQLNSETNTIDIEFLSDFCPLTIDNFTQIINHFYLIPELIKDFDVGLSLYTTNQIVKAHNGNIDFFKNSDDDCILAISIPIIN